MAAYDKMYFTMFDYVEKAMNLLIEAERECEDIFIDTDDTVEITDETEVTEETAAIEAED